MHNSLVGELWLGGGLHKMGGLEPIASKSWRSYVNNSCTWVESGPIIIEQKNMVNKLNSNQCVASIVMSAAATNQSYFAESIESCLGQTRSDFELIVVDDGLSEENRTYLNSLADVRLRVIVNERNLGQSRSVNKGMRAARGKYVIRMDADDIMLPTRIEAEVRFMDEHPDAIAAGARAELTSTGRIMPKQPYSEDELSCALLFGTTLVHPTMIIRREAATEAGLWYDEDILYAQDYMFWADALAVGKISLIPEVVLRYRVHPGQISSAKREAQTACARTIQRKLVGRMGFSLNEAQLTALSVFSQGTVRDLQSAGYAIADIDALVSTLSSQARDVMEPGMYSTFIHELRLRTVKYYMRSFRENRSLAMLGSRSFWRSLASFRSWLKYIHEL